MPKRKGRGRPKGSSVQKKAKKSADNEAVILDDPSNVLEVDPEFREEQEEGINIPKIKGRGQPKGSSLQKKVQKSADNEAVILDNPANVLEVDPEFREEQEAVMLTEKRRGRPRGSGAQDYPKNADWKDISSYLSNQMVVSPRCNEDSEAGINIPKIKGRGRLKGSSLQKKVKKSTDNQAVILDNPANVLEVDPEFREEQEAVMPTEKRRGRPRGSRAQNYQKNADGKDINSQMEVSTGCNEDSEAVMPKEKRRGRPRGSRTQTVSGVDSTSMQRGEGQPDTSVRPKRKGRGRTRGLTVQMKRKQSADGKLDVIIHPTRLVAIGPGRNDFITDLSVIVRKNARLNVHKWRQVTQTTRDAIVQAVLDNWRLEDTGIVRKAVIDEAGRLYRNWRNRLHDYYLMFETKEEALKHVPNEYDVNDSDWKVMVDYFSSPKFEIMSMKNKANKAKQLMNHACGKKAFQAVSYDARDPVTGEEPDFQTLWQLTHIRANGEWVDEASKDIHDKASEQINEKLSVVENSQDTTEPNEPEIINTVFKTLVGRKSYMQGFGSELRPSCSIGAQQLRAELAAQKKETDNARKECDEVRSKLAEVESQLEEERRKREELEVRLRQNEMQVINSQVETAIQSALAQFLPLPPPPVS